MKKKVELVTVIRDCRDGRLDYQLSRKIAHKLYLEGKLHWDVTNSQFCTPHSTDSTIGYELE